MTIAAAPQQQSPVTRQVVQVHNLAVPPGKTDWWVSLFWFAESKINYEEGTSSAPDCCEQFATTTAVDDGTHIMADYTKKTAKDDLDVRLESIKDFLGKPLYIGQYTWDGSVANTVLGSFTIESKLTGTTYWADKIEGFGLIRATACIRVQVNANPFQCGKLLIHFLPNAVERNALDTGFISTANYSLTPKSQQPGVEIDARDSVAMLRIPYVSPTNWYTIHSGSNTSYGWGNVYISVLSALATGSGGESACDVTVFMHFEDVELSAPLVPQMKGGSKGKKFSSRVVKDIASEELEYLGDKPVSSALRVAGQGLRTFAKIPLLEPIALPVSWAADAASKIASYLGWSKPPNNVSSMIVSQQYNRYQANSDGPDNSYNLALRSDNAIKISTDRTIYSEDEMSWDFLKRVNYYFSTTSWPDSTAAGTRLTNFAICPSLLYAQTTKAVGAHTATIRFGGPMYYLSSQFNLYRGSINVTFKFAKTEYHTGRLLITFTPTIGFTAAPTLATSMLALREIIDLRVSNSVTFNLPYMVESNYLNMSQGIGNLDVYILNELRHPETASSAIDILVFVEGGDDLEYAFPVNTTPLAPFTCQGGNVEEGGSAELINEGIGNGTIHSLTTRYAQESIGEQFLSVKQLLNRNSLIMDTTSSGSSTSFTFWPWARAIVFMTSGTGVLNSAAVGWDIYSRIAPMYAYFRGGMRVLVRTAQVDTSNSGRNNTVVTNLAPITLGTTNTTGAGTSYETSAYTMTQTPYATLPNNGNQGYSVANAGVGMLSVHVPYYSRCGASLNCAQTTANVVPNDISQPTTGVNFSSTQAFTTLSYYRSVKDDFQFQYFICCPPVFVSTT